MPMVYKDVEVEVDVDLDDFDDSDLLEECNRRGITPIITSDDNTQTLEAIVQALQMQKTDYAMRMLEELVYNCTGRIVVLT